MQDSVAKIPAAWLRPLPDDYRIPLWRWLLLPATALMLKRSGGVWITGELTLTESELRFVQSQLVKRSQPAAWTVALDTVSDVAVKKGLASETLQIRHVGGTITLMSARSGDFVAALRDRMTAARE